MVPVLVVAGIGALLGRRFTLDQATIGKIALNALTPALCLHTLLTTRVSGREGAHFSVPTSSLWPSPVASVSSRPWVCPAAPAAASRVATAIGNNGNMGLGPDAFALGPVGLDQSVLIFLGSVIVTFVLAPALLGSADGARGAVRAVLRLPAIWAMAAALVLRAGGWQLPTGIARGVELLSQATLPMILLALGVQLGSSQRVVVTRPIAAAVAGRILVVPALALGVGLALGLVALPLQALVLAAAMPTAVNAFILAQEYEGGCPDGRRLRHGVDARQLRHGGRRHRSAALGGLACLTRARPYAAPHSGRRQLSGSGVRPQLRRGVRGGAILRLRRAAIAEASCREAGVGIRLGQEGQPDGHPDVGHQAQRHGHRRQIEVTRHQIAIGDPHPVAPGECRRVGVRVRISGADISGCREDDRIESVVLQPFIEIDLAGAIETTDALGDPLLLGQRAERLVTRQVRQQGGYRRRSRDSDPARRRVAMGKIVAPSTSASRRSAGSPLASRKSSHDQAARSITSRRRYAGSTHPRVRTLSSRTADRVRSSTPAGSR